MARGTSPGVHVDTTVRRHKGKEYRAHLLRRSVRDGKKVRKETVANLSALPEAAITAIRRVLAGEALVAADELFDIVRARPHGHVAAVAALARQLGLPGLLGPACRERDLCFALLVARVCRPGSKLATTRWWADTTLSVDLGIDGCDSDDAYAAMDWLLTRQGSIERRLADRHLSEGGLVLYDVSSSWVEGRTCPLAAHGYSRDGKRGTRQIVYGLVTDADGRPVAVNVFAGNTGDPSAFADTVEHIVGRFDLERIVLVGDRGMITGARIDELKTREGVEWITALRAPSIKKLARQGTIQLSLFDDTDLAEVTSPDYPGERLVVCRNPALADERARKRAELLAATDAALDKVVAAVAAGRLTDAGKIGVRVGKVVNKFKMAKHYTLDIDQGRFAYTRDQEAIDTEAALDGVYVIRTSLAADRLDAPGAVTAYKRLCNVEADFRGLKTVDIEIRPIRHRLEDRVRAHALLCMLASYLAWHLRRAWAPLIFQDETPPDRDDPVAPARRSDAALHKVSRQTTPDGEVVHSLDTLIHHLATLTRDRVRFTGSHVEIDKLAQPTPTQRRAFELLDATIPLRIS
jgi:hypothetical protein